MDPWIHGCANQVNLKEERPSISSSVDLFIGSTESVILVFGRDSSSAAAHRSLYEDAGRIFE